MFEQTRVEEVLIKIKIRQQQEQFTMSITLNEEEEVFVSDIIKKVRDLINFDDSTALFYYDSTKNMYNNLQEQQMLLLPFSILVTENIINLRVQPKMSDELLANPIVKNQSGRHKRSPQRHISEVFEIVETWRSLYTRGIFNQKGELEKINLEKASTILGVPRKSLQDYHLLIRNGYNLGFDFKENSRKKVGVLRNFVKQKKKNKAEQSIQKQKIKNQQKYDELVLSQVRKQIFGMTVKQYEEQLFRVVRNSSSDEDQVYHQNQMYQN